MATDSCLYLHVCPPVLLWGELKIKFVPPQNVSPPRYTHTFYFHFYSLKSG